MNFPANNTCFCPPRPGLLNYKTREGTVRINQLPGRSHLREPAKQPTSQGVREERWSFSQQKGSSKATVFDLPHNYFNYLIFHPHTFSLAAEPMARPRKRESKYRISKGGCLFNRELSLDSWGMWKNGEGGDSYLRKSVARIHFGSRALHSTPSSSPTKRY